MKLDVRVGRSPEREFGGWMGAEKGRVGFAIVRGRREAGNTRESTLCAWVHEVIYTIPVSLLVRILE